EDRTIAVKAGGGRTIRRARDAEAVWLVRRSGPRRDGTGIRAARPAPRPAQRDRSRWGRDGRRGIARGRARDTPRRIGPDRDDADRDLPGARQEGSVAQRRGLRG